MSSIEPQTKLIAALADTMKNNMWVSEIETRCKQIKEAVREIELIIASRRGGER